MPNAIKYCAWIQIEVLVMIAFGKHPKYLLIDEETLDSGILFIYENSTVVYDKTWVDH